MTETMDCVGYAKKVGESSDGTFVLSFMDNSRKEILVAFNIEMYFGSARKEKDWISSWLSNSLRAYSPVEIFSLDNDRIALSFYVERVQFAAQRVAIPMWVKQ